MSLLQGNREGASPAGCVSERRCFLQTGAWEHQLSFVNPCREIPLVLPPRWERLQPGLYWELDQETRPDPQARRNSALLKLTYVKQVTGLQTGQEVSRKPAAQLARRKPWCGAQT